MLCLKVLQFYICSIRTNNYLLFNQLLSSTSFLWFLTFHTTLYIRSLLQWIFNLISMLYLCILFRWRNFFSSYNLEILSRCIVSNLKKNSWNVGEKFSSLSMTTTPLPHHDGDGGGFFFFVSLFKKNTTLLAVPSFIQKCKWRPTPKPFLTNSSIKKQFISSDFWLPLLK